MIPINLNIRLELVLRILSSLVGFIFLLLGMGFLIVPDILATVFYVEPSRAIGINSIRGDLGALFLGMSFFTLLGSFSSPRWLLIPSVFLILVLLGRMTSFVVDDLPMVMASSVRLELIFLTILVLALAYNSYKLNSEENRSFFREFRNWKMLTAIGLVSMLTICIFISRRQIGIGLWNQSVARRMNQNFVTNLPDGLHVGLAGTGAPIPDTKRVGVSTFVIAGTHIFIVDSGPGSTRNLELMQVPLGKIDAVLLTHFHSDHIGDLGELILKAWTTGARKKPLAVIGPEGVNTIVDGFKQAYALDSDYRNAHHGSAVADLRGNGGVPIPINLKDKEKNFIVFQNSDLKVIAFLIDHRPVIPAFGYRFDYKGRSVVISGDTLPDETLRRESRDVDLLLHEVLDPEMLSAMNQAAAQSNSEVVRNVTHDILTYHTFPEEAARIAKEANAKHLVFHHIIPPVPMTIFHQAFLGDSRQYFDGPITMGIEGMLFSLPSNSQKIEKGWLLR